MVTQQTAVQCCAYDVQHSNSNSNVIGLRDLHGDHHRPV